MAEEPRRKALLRPLRGRERMHVVAAGESVVTVSSHYAVTPQNLRDVNALGPKHLLRPGQQLIIPAASSGPPGPDEFQAVPVAPVEVVPLNAPAPAAGVFPEPSRPLPRSVTVAEPVERPPAIKPPPPRPVR